MCTAVVNIFGSDKLSFQVIELGTQSVLFGICLFGGVISAVSHLAFEKMDH
jgi:hypothetical protein